MLYVLLLAAFFVFFLGAAALFLGAAVSLVVSAGRRRWVAASISLAVMALTALPATFTFGVLNQTAWPGRYEALSANQVAGHYSVQDSLAQLELGSDGSFETSAEGWGELPAAGDWSWHPAEDWRPANDTGTIHLHGTNNDVVLALPAQRDGRLLVERRALANWGPDMKGFVMASRLGTTR